MRPEKKPVSCVVSQPPLFHVRSSERRYVAVGGWLGVAVIVVMELGGLSMKSAKITRKCMHIQCFFYLLLLVFDCVFSLFLHLLNFDIPKCGWNISDVVFFLQPKKYLKYT